MMTPPPSRRRDREKQPLGVGKSCRGAWGQHLQDQVPGDKGTIDVLRLMSMKDSLCQQMSRRILSSMEWQRMMVS